MRRQLFGREDPIDETIRLQKLSCTVVGLLAAKGASASGPDQDDVIVIPLRTFQRRVSGNRDVSSMLVAVKSDVVYDFSFSSVSDERVIVPAPPCNAMLNIDISFFSFYLQKGYFQYESWCFHNPTLFYNHRSCPSIRY